MREILEVSPLTLRTEVFLPLDFQSQTCLGPCGEGEARADCSTEGVASAEHREEEAPELSETGICTVKLREEISQVFIFHSVKLIII